MNEWKIDYWCPEGSKKSPIERWFDKLTNEQLAAVRKVMGFLKKKGNELIFPQSKPLGKGLFELRENHFGYRIYYCFKGERLIIILASGDKSSQDKDIIIARERMKS